jgi:hypothetical protein
VELVCNTTRKSCCDGVPADSFLVKIIDYMALYSTVLLREGYPLTNYWPFAWYHRGRAVRDDPAPTDNKAPSCIRSNTGETNRTATMKNLVSGYCQPRSRDYQHRRLTIEQMKSPYDDKDCSVEGSASNLEPSGDHQTALRPSISNVSKCSSRHRP